MFAPANTGFWAGAFLFGWPNREALKSERIRERLFRIMTFLNPWLLAGVAAIAAPIVIHLMMRRQVRRMKWAAMRFLQIVVERNERKLRIEDRLLLLLRCLLLILLALALARPAFRAVGMVFGGGSRTIVLALDNSESMGLTDGGASRFDNARKAAGQIVDALPPGSAAALLSSRTWPGR